ncbi:hypothetical protein CTA2_11169 [Colletotrichum tanaceti]|nr:hypothetical protein CTA2_11169 [Colletotrichum tanaceti]
MDWQSTRHVIRVNRGCSMETILDQPTSAARSSSHDHHLLDPPAVHLLLQHAHTARDNEHLDRVPRAVLPIRPPCQINRQPAPVPRRAATGPLGPRPGPAHKLRDRRRHLLLGLLPARHRDPPHELADEEVVSALDGGGAFPARGVAPLQGPKRRLEPLRPRDERVGHDGQVQFPIVRPNYIVLVPVVVVHLHWFSCRGRGGPVRGDERFWKAEDGRPAGPKAVECSAHGGLGCVVSPNEVAAVVAAGEPEGDVDREGPGVPGPRFDAVDRDRIRAGADGQRQPLLPQSFDLEVRRGGEGCQ